MFVRLLRGVGANAFGQIVIAGLQIGLVPIFTSHWGVERYGVWLLIFTIPSYLALGDFGFATAAGTDMTMRVAVGDRQGAVTTFQSAFMLVTLSSCFLLLLAVVTVTVLPNELLSLNGAGTVADLRWTLICVFAYGILCLTTNVLMAGFRSTGLYATGVMISSMIQLFEGVACMVILARGGSLITVALGYLLCRSLGILFKGVALVLLIPWLPIGYRYASVVEVGRLTRPAFAVMALPAAQATFLQGTSLVLAVATSASTVALFSTTRTLVRAGVQLVTVVNHAVMPEYSRAVATRDSRMLRRMVLLTLSCSLAILVPCAVALLVWGPKIISVWTRGAIIPNWSFIALMTGMMFVNGIWHPFSNLLLASNRHASYSYLYLVCAAVSVLATYPLSLLLRENGAALSLLMLDLFMLIYILRLFSSSRATAAPSSFEYPKKAKL